MVTLDFNTTICYEEKCEKVIPRSMCNAWKRLFVHIFTAKVLPVGMAGRILSGALAIYHNLHDLKLLHAIRVRALHMKLVERVVLKYTVQTFIWDFYESTSANHYLTYHNFDPISQHLIEDSIISGFKCT